MKIHLVDGTYELFRAYFGNPEARSADGREVGATVGLMRSLLGLVRYDGATHIACAFDTVVESFRNDLFDGYKTGEGIEPDLLDQFPLAEQAVRALGMTCWSMIEFEADDAMATAAARWRDESGVEQVVLCTPDKDMAQCVVRDKVVMLDRRRRIVIDERGVHEKYGVAPESIPDWLALVGDAADGLPGLKGWGRKTAARVLSRYRKLESIPKTLRNWDVEVRGAMSLLRTLTEQWDDALLYRKLATLRLDADLTEGLDDIQWRGAPRDELTGFCETLGAPEILERVTMWRER